MFLKLASKNILAYRKRSIITLLLITVSTALLVFSTALMDGSHNVMLKNAVEIYPGYIQITDHKFRKNPSLDNLIFTADKLAAILDNLPEIAWFSQRYESFVLLSSDLKSVGSMLTGIQPEMEQHISRLKESLISGDYLDDDDQGLVYVGKELAEKLNITVGDQLTFIGTGADYSFAADRLKVKGIFQTGLFSFDATTAFVSKKYFDQIMSSQNVASHFIIQPVSPEKSAEIAQMIRNNIGLNYQAQSWQETMTGLVQGMKIDSIFGYITLGVLFIVIFFVIMIYTLLVIMARIREIGILRAVGTSQKQIFWLLNLENGIISLAGVLAGGCIGATLAFYFYHNPIYFSGFEDQFKQYGLAVSSMPTEFSPPVILRDMGILFILSLVSGLYPILKINRLSPIEAIHHG